MSNCADSNKELIGMVIILGAIIVCLFFMYPKINSITNGGPTIPKECINGFSENITYGGQVITSYIWSDECCTKRYVGYTGSNNYNKICWKKNDVLHESKDDNNVSSDGVKN